MREAQATLYKLMLTESGRLHVSKYRDEVERLRGELVSMSSKMQSQTRELQISKANDLRYQARCTEMRTVMTSIVNNGLLSEDEKVKRLNAAVTDDDYEHMLEFYYA